MLYEVHYLSIILEYLFMKRIVILLALITSLAYGQEQNFLEKPYYRTQVNADTLVVPDKIYLQIALSEKDSREKKSTEELYNKMIQSLQVAKIDIQKQLSVYGMSSTYDKKIFKTNINKAENYELLVPDAATALNVIALLEKNGISNVRVNRKEYSQSDRVLQLLREKALKKAKYEAESLMKVVGQGIGKVLSIQEYNHTYLKGSAMYMKAAELDVAERSYTPDFSPIQLQMEFSVVFEIK